MVAPHRLALVQHHRLAAPSVTAANGNARVGAALKSRPMTPGEKVGELIWAAAGGVFAYTLYTGTMPFTSKHPVWGTVFAFGVVSRLAGIAVGSVPEEA